MSDGLPKLVRDGVPGAIRQRGARPIVSRTNTASQQREFLLKKLLEEAGELVRQPSVEEIADVLEVIWAIAEAHGFSEGDVVRCREEKRRARGIFEQGYILHAIIEPEEDDA